VGELSEQGTKNGEGLCNTYEYSEELQEEKYIIIETGDEEINVALGNNQDIDKSTVDCGGHYSTGGLAFIVILRSTTLGQVL